MTRLRGDDGGTSLIQTEPVTLMAAINAAIGSTIAGRAARTVEAEGLVLAPGFIDIHSHTDLTIFKHPGGDSKAFQGVTLDVVGNCGLGVFPVQADRQQELAGFLRLHGYLLPDTGFSWRDLASYAREVEDPGIGINLAPLVGHGPLRIAAMGMEDREPTATELERMRRMLSEALRQGAWGMSTGLIYPPGSFARTDELIALAKVLAAHGALYASHIRNESAAMLAALDEAVAIGRESGARVQVSHLKALGKSNWGRFRQVLARLAAARSAGVNIAADQYPYDASATTLAALIPQWAQDGGVAKMIDRLQAPELRARLLTGIGEEIAVRAGAEGIIVTDIQSPGNRDLIGKDLGSIANSWQCGAEEAVIRLLVEEAGAVGAIFFCMAEEDVAGIMADPQVAIGSDGHGLDAAACAGEATHPRSYGTFPRVLSRYVREQKVLSLEGAIRKMTALPASRLGLPDRGVVKEGYVADLVLFDPATIKDLADYAVPHRYAHGIIHLLVGGEFVIEDGRLTGRRPGRVLRRPGSEV